MKHHNIRRKTLVVAVGLLLSLSPGCSRSNEAVFTAGAVSSPATVRGVLARSATGAVALLDQPLPAGFTPLVGAGVSVVGEGVTARSNANGVIELPAGQGRVRLVVTTPEGDVKVIESVAFSPSAGPAVALEHIPARLGLVAGEAAAMRAVGVDKNGAYLPVQAQQALEPLADSVQIPLTSLPALQTNQSADAGGGQRLVSTVGGLSVSGDVSSFSAPCQAMLSGQILDAGKQPIEGAIVQVEGSTASARTRSDGKYQFQHLAPVPSVVHVYYQNQQIGLGVAPLASQLLTRLDIPERPATYQPGTLLPVAGATGVAVRPNGFVLVSTAGSLQEFNAAGVAQTPPVLAKPLSGISGVAADFYGQPYVADTAAQKIELAGTTGTELQATAPIALTVDSGANLLALSQGGSGLEYFANETANAWKAAVAPGSGLLNQPTALAAGQDGRIFVADAGNSRIAVLELTQNGRLLHGDPGLGALADIKAQVSAHWASEAPLGIAVGPNEEVYVAGAGGVVCTDDSGQDPIVVSTQAALGPISVDKNGTVWVAQTGGVQAYRPATAAVVPTAFPAPTGQSLITGADLTALDKGITAAMQQFDWVGGTLAVSVNGRLVLTRGYGYSQLDLTQQTPTQPNTLFRLASCSKTFTAAAALLQQQDYPAVITPQTQPFTPGGLLAGGQSGYDLSADGFQDSRQASVTTLELLQMTAGLDNPTALYSPLARTLGGATPPATAIQTLLYIYSHSGLGSEPGTAYVYSDVAYMTLGRLIESVAQSQGLNVTYAQYVQQRLLTPLGITDMQLADTNLNGTAANEAHYYPFTGEACGQSVFTNSPLQVPATYGSTYDGVSHDSTGGWISSASDLVKLANALAPNNTPPGFVNPLDATRQAIFKAVPTFSGAKMSAYFGCGWQMSSDQNGVVTSMVKDGGLPGTSTFVSYQRQGSDQVVFAYLLNGRPGPGSKRQSNGIAEIQAPIKAFLAAQAGHWPASGNLFP